MLHDRWTWTAVLSVLVFKVVATALTAGSGAVGGVFTPMLFVGAASGFLFGQGVGALWSQASAPFAYSIVGMGAFLAVATSAPIMAILMTFEMTLSVPALLPLVLACIVAYFVALPSNARAMYSVTLQHRRNRQTRGRLRQLCVKDLIKPAETVLPLTASFADMIQMLREHSVKYIYIVNDAGWFCGVVHAQDVTLALADESDTNVMKAADLLHRDFPVLRENQGLGEALQVFLGHQSERLPVLPANQPPVLLGVAYKTSLLEAYYQLHQPLL
jgi:CIC family chloride channel protein